jgi:hypothetical protein
MEKFYMANNRKDYDPHDNSKNLFETLMFLGIDIPPQHDGSSAPKKWLLRGQSIPDLNPDTQMMPFPGEMYRWGVFFGDHRACIANSPKNMLVVFELGEETRWIATNSDKFNELAHKHAQNNGIDITKLGGGIECYQHVCKTNNIYCNKKGIFTFHQPQLLRRATYILMPEDQSRHLTACHPVIRKKIITY